MTPIDRALDLVVWEELPIPGDGNAGTPPQDGIPYATHTGVLTLAGFTLRAFRLSDGRRIFDKGDLEKALGVRL